MFPKMPTEIQETNMELKDSKMDLEETKEVPKPLGCEKSDETFEEMNGRKSLLKYLHTQYFIVYVEELNCK